MIFNTLRQSTNKPHNGSFSFLVRLLTFLSILLVSLTQTVAAEISAAASVQNRSMTLGQSNTYTITFQNAPNIPQLPPPTVPGLQFAPSASSRTSTNIINGVISRETSLSWSFQAEAVGRHTIPDREIRIGDQSIRIRAATVEVTEMPPEMRDRFFLRWRLPTGPFYVGQAIPASLQLYVRGDLNASLASQPDGASEQFLKTPFSREPRQSQGELNGRSFIMVEWDTVITPIRSGEGALPVNLVLNYNTGQMQRDFFGTRPIQEQIRLSTDSTPWEILDLPRTGRPASFSGAVGTFEVESRLSAREAETGDPISFTLEVRGEGNFERIQPPTIPETDGWRIYPPRTQMKEEDVPYRGVRTFEYILSPTRESVEELPPVPFSWFDPDRAVWEEQTLGSDPVRIRPGSGPSSTRAVTRTEPASSPLFPADGLLPMAQTPGGSQTLKSPWRQPLFWVFNGGMGFLSAIALAGLVRRRQADRNPYLQLRSEATRKARTLAAHAIKAAEHQEASAFYLHATRSLRHFLAFLDPQSHNPESLTWHELEGVLRKFSFDESSLAHTRTLFERQDAVHFAGWSPTADELRLDREAFQSLLNQIALRKS